MEELNRAAAVRIEAGRPGHPGRGSAGSAAGQRGARQAPGPPPRLGQGAIFFLFCFDGEWPMSVMSRAEKARRKIHKKKTNKKGFIFLVFVLQKKVTHTGDAHLSGLHTVARALNFL